MILTRLDGDARGGAALSMRAVTGKPIKFAGVGEALDELEAFHPERVAGRILGMGDVVSLVEQDVLPIPEQLLERDEEETHESALLGDFIYEPEPEEILARLLPVYVETELYRALLESAASEQGARMTAMRNASSNAGDLIESLTLDMNRARQSEITQEILEVVAGADALTQ